MPYVPYTTSTTISARLEIRSKLAALASHHGIALVSRRDHWDTCERLLVGSRGEGAREIHAVLAALRCGIVADLVAWRADGVAAVERELTRRLADRAGIEPGLAYWAIESWALAYKIPLSGDEPTAPELEQMSPQRGRDVVIRARHIVLAGAIAGLAVAGTVVSGGLSAFRSADTSDSTTTAPQPTRRVPQQMAARNASNNRRKPAARPQPRDTTRAAQNSRRVQSSLGDIVTRMPRASRGQPSNATKPPKRASPAEIRAIREAFAMEPARGTTPKTRPGPEAPPKVTVASRPATPAAVQSGAAASEPSCGDWRPRLRRNHSPSIPDDLQARGITSGRVVLRFRVDNDGYPDAGSARVLETSSSALVGSALEALEHLRYEAAPRASCEPVWIERTIRFW